MKPQKPNIAPSSAMPTNQNVHLVRGYEGLVISHDSARVYFCLREAENHYLRAMDADTRKIVATYSAGRYPNIKGLSPDSTQAFALDMYTAKLYEINTIDHSVKQGTKISPRPLTDMVVHPNGKSAYICADEYLLEFNTVNQTVARSLLFSRQGLLSYPDNLSINSSGSRLYISCWNDGRRHSIEVVDTARMSLISSIPVSGFHSNITISPDEKFVYSVNISDRETIMIDAASNEVINTLQHSTATRSICCSPNGLYLFTVRSESEYIWVLDAKNLKEINKINTGETLLREVRMRSDNGDLFVLHGVWK